MNRTETIRRILRPLEPYLNDLVLIGGWAAWLYLEPYGKGTSLTAEADLVLPAELPAGERQGMGALLAEAGFRPDAGGAVWRAGTGTAEEIEFLVPHTGPALQEGQPTDVQGQPDLRAIPLGDLWLLWKWARHTEVPGLPPLHVQAPSVGAYVANKAATFGARPPDGDRYLRAGKDILYLADLALAGEPLLTEIAGDLDQLLAADQAERRYVERAASHLRLLRSGSFAQPLEEAVEMKAVRDGLSLGEARATVQGSLEVLVDLLARPPG